MAGFSNILTLLTAGLARNKDDTPLRNSPTGARTAPNADAYTGDKAVPRNQPLPLNAPLATADATSSALVTARQAGERARKRAAAGGTVLTSGQQGQAAPGAAFTPLTLLGS